MKKVIEYGIQEGEPVFRLYEYKTLEQAKEHIDIRYKEFENEFEDYEGEDFTLGRGDNIMWETDLINDCNLIIEIIEELETSKLEGVE